jgi:hypothetical protein
MIARARSGRKTRAVRGYGARMLRTSAVAILPLTLAATGAAQSGCLDQSYLPPSLTNGLEVTANQPVTQTFTCGRTGQLTMVEISRIRHHNGITSNPLTVSIVITVAGVPTPTAMASVVVPPASISTSAIAPLPIDLSSFSVFVQAGQVLGLALTSPNAPGTPSYAWWGEAPGGSYAAGQIFIQQTVSLPVWDLAFQTWVTQPASWTNYGAGHAGTFGAPTLWMSANPVLGTTPLVVLSNSATALTVGALFFGVAPASVPTPWGGTALVQPLVSAGLVLPPAGSALSLAIPNDPTLCGFTLYAQGVVVDAGASAGLAFTPGLALVLGS